MVSRKTYPAERELRADLGVHPGRVCRSVARAIPPGGNWRRPDSNGVTTVISRWYNAVSRPAGIEGPACPIRPSVRRRSAAAILASQTLSRSAGIEGRSSAALPPRRGSDKHYPATRELWDWRWQLQAWTTPLAIVIPTPGIEGWLPTVSSRSRPCRKHYPASRELRGVIDRWRDTRHFASQDLSRAAGVVGSILVVLRGRHPYPGELGIVD